MQTGSVALHAKYAHLNGKMERTLEYLRTADHSGMKKGDSVEIEDGVLVRMQNYTTAPASGILFESHRSHFDIHYMVEGEETFGCMEGELPPEGAYDEPTDTQLHLTPAHSGMIVLRQGDYAIVSPDEPHKPRCSVDAPMDVKKIVVKVRV